MTQFNVPIAFIVFNRPGTTIRVFEEIRRIKPRKLLVVADGPRANRLGDADKCAQVRAIVEQVDWPCEVLRNYAVSNMGCKKRVSSGLEWVFEQVEEAVILEDDCLPHPTFFLFCEQLLERYRDDERVGIISGDNFLFGEQLMADSYYFSRYSHIWGWATWRRTWQSYDVDMKQWPVLKKSGWLNNILHDNKMVTYWTHIFDAVYYNKIKTWDYQLVFSNMLNSKLNIMPNRNLVSNIGFGNEATLTTEISEFSEMPVSEMKFPLVHPDVMMRNAIADGISERDQFTFLPIYVRMKNFIRYLIRKIIQK